MWGFHGGFAMGLSHELLYIVIVGFTQSRKVKIFDLRKCDGK